MLTDKLLTLAFGLLLLLMIACGDGPASDQTKATTPPVVKEMSRSAAFLDYAASTTMLQAELAQVAAERAESEQIKALSAEMQGFYRQALKQLQQVAKAEGLHNSLPDSLGSADRATIAEFRKLSGTAFDERYREFVQASQQAQLDHYSEMLLKAEEEQIRSWVNEMQLQLRARLQLAAQYDSAR
ncbi:DUF4142 domain-containing protein [Pontibacter ramchanderi]|uniref:Putative outer membrane protein n=1 Tax=Pontibacter ramchanderi TaxID=1179743 RepID=A0A2N3UBZ8_9BACT|nr:DUF4142 domain-containing protein [Pontibacter ramchanderi]PKV66894.1 putative outer membrane protein [Pontibacter ramchanderi]